MNGSDALSRHNVVPTWPALKNFPGIAMPPIQFGITMPVPSQPPYQYEFTKTPQINKTSENI